MAGTGAGCRRQPIPVAAEAGAFCRRVRRTQADAPLAFLAISAAVTCPILRTRSLIRRTRRVKDDRRNRSSDVAALD